MKTQFPSAKQQVSKFLGLLGLLFIFSIIANPVYAQNQERIVTGVVSSMDGPLLGAAIILKGTSIGVVSNDKGEFTFPQGLKENDVLVVSYLGYETDEITIDNNTTFIEPYLEDIAIVVVAAIRTN